MNLEFLKPRLNGSRFEEHSIPLEFLKDFAALEEMIIEVAKWKYRQEHPERERLPRGFTSGLELHITGVEEGSAIPVIVLAISALFPPANSFYLEKARDAIIESVASAHQEGAQVLTLPPNLLGYFDRFGRSLREGESLEFRLPNREPVRLTIDTRRRLIRASQVEEWTEETSLRGAICEADQARMGFELELKDGTRLKAPLNSLHLDSVLDAFRGYRAGLQVQLQGVVKRDRQDRLKSIESVEHISPLDPLDVSARLEELAELKDGWLDGKGQALDPSGLTWLSTSFDKLYDSSLPLPYLYPTAEGSIQAEWTLDKWEISLEIAPLQKTADYQALNLVSNECQEISLDLSATEGWQELNETLKAVSPEAA
jgi:hypothetical protein